MSIQKRHTLQENIIDILNLCRQPRTKHFIKDKFNFSNDKLKKVIADLQSQGLIKVSMFQVMVGEHKQFKQQKRAKPIFLQKVLSIEVDSKSIYNKNMWNSVYYSRST